MGRHVRSEKQFNKDTTVIVDKQYNAISKVIQESAPYLSTDTKISWTLRKYDPYGRLYSSISPIPHSSDSTGTIFAYNSNASVLIDGINLPCEKVYKTIVKSINESVQY